MITNLTNTHTDLAAGGLLNIHARAGQIITCERGLLWVTLEGEPLDHWLVAGESMTVRRRGNVIIEAAQASRMAFAEPAKAQFAFRWPKFSRRAAVHCAA